MIHKAHAPSQQNPTVAKLGGLMTNLAADDARVEAIIKAHTKIPDAKWEMHALQDVTFDAHEAVQFGVADSIREFAVPAGSQIFNI